MDFVDYNVADVFAILEAVKSSASELIESDTIEFKEYSSEKALHNDKGLAEEICALANHRGGVVIIGIKDSSKLNSRNWHEQLVGFGKVDETKTTSRIKGRLQNAVNIRVENISYESVNFTAIFILRNHGSLVTTTSGKTCIRDGRDSRPMTPEEIEAAVKSLHTYDWSSDILHSATYDDLNNSDVQSALNDYCIRRELEKKPSVENFLESIEATKNGVLTKGGLLFFGNKSSIEKHLGNFEFRFSWKEGVDLKINEVWSGNLWSSINKAKSLFNKCVLNLKFDYKGNFYEVPNLDPQAFHEAFINAIVHRDYSTDGMISVEFSGKRLTVTSPGLFYGGVTSNNIALHDPRHRNKALARIMMQFKLVDRAGMGILRMGVRSLVYGRSFPSFDELSNSVRVNMEAEYIRPGIFVLTRSKSELHIPDLIILNSLYEKGCLTVPESMELVSKTTNDPWNSILGLTSRWIQFVELCGSKIGVFIRVKENAKELFGLQKYFRTPANSPKYVELFKFLKEHKSVTNEDVSALLKYSHSSTTSRFLGDIEWVSRAGQGVSSRWSLTQAYS